MEIISRKDAASKGLKHYFTGKKCKYGHIAKRYVSAKKCILCGKIEFLDHYNSNNEYHLARRKSYYYNNPEKARESRLIFKTRNPEYFSSYKKVRKASDPLYSIKERARVLICNSLSRRGFKKGSKTSEIIGCSFDELKRHLESKFKEGMSWDNRGEWHIDHIIPLALGSTEEEVIALNHYTNLQPLWAKDNLSKGAAHCEIQANKFFSGMGCRK